MFNSLELINFQSHKKTRLEFHAGVNAIVGVSDSGKSAILRSIHWVRENRPTGTGHISHFVKDSKGKILENCEVTLTINGTPIKRIRGEKENSYIVGDKALEAMGVTVPKEVSEVFNFSEVNVQKQLDAPFLLSKSGGEVARFFSSVVNLEDMTKLLSHAKKVEADETKEKKIKEKRAKEVAKELKGFDWIDEAKPILETTIALEKTLEDKKAQAGDLVRKIEAFKLQNEKIARCEPILKAAEIVAQTKAISQAIKDREDARFEIGVLKNNILSTQTHLRALEPILKQADSLAELKNIVAQIENKRQKKANLHSLIGAFKTLSEQIEKSSRFVAHKDLVFETSALLKNLEEKKLQAKTLKETILSAKNAETLQKQALKLVLNAPNLQEIKDLEESILAKKNKISAISRVVGAIGALETTISSSIRTVLELEAKLPEKCSECGQFRVKHSH